MRLSLVLAVAALCAASSCSWADPVTYTLSGNLSGTIGTTDFTDIAATFTFIGNTAGITSLGAGYYTDTAGLSTITLDGIGTASFLSPTFGVESEYDGAAFYDVPTGFGVGIYDPSLGYYALTSPFSDTSYFTETFGAASNPELTTLGGLTITDGDFQNPTTTFQANGVAPQVTPEPSSLLLAGTGALGIIGMVRRRLA